MRISEVWDELILEKPHQNQPGVIKRIVAPNSGCRTYVGIRHPSLTRLFMVEILARSDLSVDELPSSRGFNFKFDVTGSEADGEVTLVVESSHRNYDEIFQVMVENIVSSLESILEKKIYFETILESLTRWKLFFENIDESGLGDTAQRGLYGELHFLNTYLLSSKDKMTSELKGWTGAKRRQHDFQYGHNVVEVKSSIGKQHQKLQISSEQQLDESLVGSLYLYHLSLSVIESGSNTLVKLVEDLRGKFAQNQNLTLSFENSLISYGYLDLHASKYRKTGYVIREDNIFLVRHGFPRLTEKDLPKGVGDLSYSIAIAECKNYSVKISEALAVIREGIS